MNPTRLLRAWIVPALLLLSPAVHLAAEIPDSIDFGTIGWDDPALHSFSVTNDGGADVAFSLFTTCSCITIEPTEVVVPRGDTVDVRVAFDPYGFDGATEGLIVVASNDQRFHGRRIELSATVVPSGPVGVCLECSSDPLDEATERFLQTATADLTDVSIYLDAGCRECRRFLDEQVPRIRAGATRRFVVSEHDVMNPARMDELLARLEAAGQPLREFPVAFVGERVLQGLDELERDLGEAIAAGGDAPAGASASASDRSFTDDTAAGSAADGVRASRLPTVGAVLAAGLVDGINPCAFSTILFLISMLALVGRERREIFTVGMVFTATVFLGYLATGFGLFSAARSLLVFPLMAQLIRWVLVGSLAVLAVLSARDALLARAGRSGEMTLQLSKAMKRRIHGVMRTRLRTGSLVGGTIVIGVLVTIFEFSCTGQVYLPVIMHVARTQTDLGAYALIVAYNVAFILPLVVVFAAAWSGVAVGGITRLFSRNVATVKFALAAVFGMLAVMTVVL